MSQNTTERKFKGIPVSGGICQGTIVLIDAAKDHIPERTIAPHQVSHELDRLEQAILKTRHQIREVQKQVCEAMGAEDATIFEAHLAILDDRTILDEVVRKLKKDLLNVEAAFHEVAEKFATTLEAISDDYLRERAGDVRDVTSRVMNNLLGKSEVFDPSSLPHDSIILAHDLTPSMTARLDRNQVQAFATEVGSRTSHTAILARSLAIPAVVGLHDITSAIPNGATALLDGYNGYLIINPSNQTLFEYGELSKKQINWSGRLADIREQPAVTKDGFEVHLGANMERPEDVSGVIKSGAEGVALFRTEYLFLNRDSLPSEEEQFQAYKFVASELSPAPVIIRTLDIGGDKLISHMDLPEELNPFLGWRAIRYCLQEEHAFRDQLKAILRASAFGEIKMMYPMISGHEELKKANAILESCKQDLSKKGIAFDSNLEVGAMIEVPSAVMIADSLAKKVKFFSLGTNDLIQYTLAADRMNERVAHLYQPSHPAILRMIKLTVDAAKKNNIGVSVCGEMASDVEMTPLLLGLGVNGFGMAPPLIPKVKYLIRNLNFEDTVKLADYALSCECPDVILSQSRDLVREAAPDLIENSP